MGIRGSTNWTQMQSDMTHCLELIVESTQLPGFPEEPEQEAIDSFVDKLREEQSTRHTIMYNTFRHAGSSRVDMKKRTSSTMESYFPKNPYARFALRVVALPAVGSLLFGNKVFKKFLPKAPEYIGGCLLFGAMATGSMVAQQHFDSLLVQIPATYVQISTYAAGAGMFFTLYKSSKLINDPYYMDIRMRAIPSEIPVNYQFRSMIANKLERDTVLKLEHDPTNKSLMDDIKYLKALQEE